MKFMMNTNKAQNKTATETTSSQEYFSRFEEVGRGNWEKYATQVSSRQADKTVLAPYKPK